MSTIPKLIFQTWKSKTVLPDNYTYWRSTFKKHNPDYTLLLWDDQDNRDFIAQHFAWFLPIYDGFPREIFRVDAVRFFFLYLHGGIYVDLDTECVNPLDPLLAAADVVLGWMGNDPTFEHAIPNAIMLSRPRQEFWLLAIATMMDQVGKDSRPEYVTGPVVLKRAVEQYGPRYEHSDVQSRLADIRSRLAPGQEPAPGKSRLAVLPGFALYPLDWNDQIHNTMLRRPMLEQKQVLSEETVKKLFPKSFMVTYWTHSWSKDQ